MAEIERLQDDAVSRAAAARDRRRLARAPRLPRAAEVDPPRRRPARQRARRLRELPHAALGERSSRGRSSSAGTRSASRPTGTEAAAGLPVRARVRRRDPRAARPAAGARRARSASPSAKGAGYEADDFLAAAVASEEKRGGTTLVATSDRDAFQLASERTTILQPVRGVSELRADRPGRGARALRRRAGAGAGLHRAARRPVGQDPRRARASAPKTAADVLSAVRLARGRARGRALRGQAEELRALPPNRNGGRLRPSPRSPRPGAARGRRRPRSRASGG